MTKSYSKDTEEVYFFEVGVQYPEELHRLHVVLLFLPETIKIARVVNLVNHKLLREKVQLN